MKYRILTVFVCGLSAAFTGCVQVDDEVAAAPSVYWKAPKDALVKNEIAPEQIKTDKIINDSAASSEGTAVRTTADSVKSAAPKQQAVSAAEKLENGQLLQLSDILDIALENNTQTRIYWFQAKSYAAQLGGANSAYYPQVSVSASVYRSRVTPSVSYFPSIGRYYETGFGPSAEINWLIYDFGKREAQVESAREALRAANYDYNQTIQDVALNVNVAYFNLYSAMGSVRAASMAIADAKASYDSANAKLEEGVGKKQDMLNALANYRNAEYYYEKAVSSVETARANLAAVMGIRVSANLKISDEVKLPVSSVASQKIEELTAKALRGRQSVLAAYAQLMKTSADVKTARRDFLPQIGAYGQASYTDYSANERSAAQQYTVGAQLSWSIFEGFARKYQLISARAMERAEAQKLKAEEIKIISDIWTYFHNYQSALRQVASMKAAVDANEQAYNATRIGYENSVNSITDLLNAQSSLSTAREEQVAAEANLAVSVARLAHAAGALTAGIQ